MKIINDDSILRLKYINRGNKVISVPNGYSSVREIGNVYEHNGDFYWIATCDKYENGKRLYSLHIWNCKYSQHQNIENWDYLGKITIKDKYGKSIEGEDASIWFEDNKWRILYENKTLEINERVHAISYAIGSSQIMGTYFQQGDTVLKPSYQDNYWENGVYSPELSGDKLSDGMFFGGRKRTVRPYTELSCFANYTNGKFVPLNEPVLDGTKYGFQSSDWSGSPFKLKDKYVCQIGGLRGWTEENQNDIPPKHYFCNGLAVGDTLTTGWKTTVEEIKDQYGKFIFTQIFYVDNLGWRAIGYSLGEKDICICTIATGSGDPVIPPNNGENDMLDLKVTAKPDNKVLLEWNYPHPDNANNVHFEDDGGYFATKDILAKGSWTFTNSRNATKFRIRTEQMGLYEAWVKLETTDPPVDPDPVYGCTNPTAENYNPLATVDDGSCIFEPTPPNDNEFYKSAAKDYINNAVDELMKALKEIDKIK